MSESLDVNDTCLGVASKSLNAPLSAANMALPWIMFVRDRDRFEREFPEFRILSIRPFMPLRYLLSGGVSVRSLVPASTFGLWRAIENALDSWRDRLGMFAQVRIEDAPVGIAQRIAGMQDSHHQRVIVQLVVLSGGVVRERP